MGPPNDSSPRSPHLSFLSPPHLSPIVFIVSLFSSSRFCHPSRPSVFRVVCTRLLSNLHLLRVGRVPELPAFRAIRRITPASYLRAILLAPSSPTGSLRSSFTAHRPLIVPSHRMPKLKTIKTFSLSTLRTAEPLSRKPSVVQTKRSPSSPCLLTLPMPAPAPAPAAMIRATVPILVGLTINNLSIYCKI